MLFFTFDKHFHRYVVNREDYFAQMPWSDFKVFELVFQNLPDHIVLQLGNSSTIRYAQLFQMNATHTVFSNRGTSGIDGSTSTAIGAAMAIEQPVVFITGDLSFFYDSNALWNNYIPKNFKIILINNSGGGIFRILPGHKDTVEFDTFFDNSDNNTIIFREDNFVACFIEELPERSDLETVDYVFYGDPKI